MITVVTGSPRCGSTLLMRMLSAGGMPVFADNTTSLETRHALTLPHQTAFLAECDGKAVKILEPLFTTPPPTYEYRFLLCLRDETEQATSQRKFLNALQHTNIPASVIPRLAQSLREDIPRMRRMLATLGDVLEVRFEKVLEDAPYQAERIASFVNTSCPLDIAAMCAVVIPRSSRCLPGLLELEELPGQTR